MNETVEASDNQMNESRLEKDKGKKKDTSAVEETIDFIPVANTFESEILIHKKFSDEQEKIKSLDDIIYEMDEAHFFVQKSNLAIFRFEDVIFTVFPHLSALKRKGGNIIDIFKNNDPFVNKSSNPIDVALNHERIRESEDLVQNFKHDSNTGMEQIQSHGS